METAEPYKGKLQTSADASQTKQLLDTLVDDQTRPFTGLQAVQAMYEQLRELGENQESAPELIAADPDAWWEMMHGGASFLEDVRIAIKQLQSSAKQDDDPERRHPASGPDLSMVTGTCGRCAAARDTAEHQERCVAKGDQFSIDSYFRALNALHSGA